LRDRAYLPSRLLAEFYLLRRSEQSRELPLIPPEHIGWVYDSLRSAESKDLWVDLVLDGADPGDEAAETGTTPADGEFILGRPGAHEEEATRLEFRANIAPTSTVSFGRYVKDATITVPCQVTLGAAGSEYEIGPRVQISCGSLRLQAESLVVGGKVVVGRGDASGVALEATRCDANISQKPKVHCDFHVSWPDSRLYPWTEYSQERVEPFAAERLMNDAYRRFRRIVLTLRSHSKGSLARYRAKVEHQRVLQGRLGEALLQQLLIDGTLRLDGKFYHWVPEVAARTVGISWQQLSSWQVTDTLAQYLRAFLRRYNA
jgi:hypothetical protein